MAPKVMLVAAESSGDLLGAGLARALKARLPGVELVGVGGAKMAAEGISSPFEISQLSVLGIFEGVAAYPRVVARVKDTLALAKAEQPDVAVLIDSWGFTLRVAQALKRWNPALKVVKFVGPQVWASRAGRAKTLAATVDHLLSILPFDQPFYLPYGLPVTFVGNPTMSRSFDHADAGRARTSLGAKPGDHILLVLPGSRPAEIKRLMEPFGDAVRRMRVVYPDLIVAVPVAGPVAAAVKEQVSSWPQPIHVIEDEAEKCDAMKAATVALVCSGTVSTEVALCGAPMVIAYRVGEATFQVMRRLATISYITLFNIAARKPIAPEFIQGDCTGPKLAAALAARLDDPGLRAMQVEAQNSALALMGRDQADPYTKAAEVVAGLVGDQP